MGKIMTALTKASLILVSASGGAVYAQSEQPEPDPNRFVVEEVIVTANRREQSLQEVPMSVSAFNSDFFKDTGATDLSSLEQYTPSLKITPGTDSRSTSIRIRGIGSVGTNAGIDPSVGIFIDGVYQGRAGMSISDLIDIERVEVLRGPQGTLYGKNTAAGAISVITKKPAPEFEAEAEAVYANNDRKELRGMVNFPLGKDAAIRLTGFGTNGDHIYTNTFNGEHLNDANKWGLKSRLLFDMDTSGELLITLDYTKEDTDCCALAVIDYDGLSTLNTPFTNTPTASWEAALGVNEFGDSIVQYNAFETTEGFSPPTANPFGDNVWLDTELFNDVEVGGLAAEWNVDLENSDTITFINAWRHYESFSGIDGDFSAYDAVTGTTDVELDQYSSELRITSPGGDTWNYQGGIYAYYSEFDAVGTFFQGVPLVNNISPAFGAEFPDGSLNIDTNLYSTTSYAAFGQLEWSISEKFSATLGLRYTYEQKEREGSQITLPETLLDAPPVAGPDIYYDQKRSDTDISPAINLRYFINDELMTYASISRGFKSGGFNQRRELEGNSGEFDEEIATNYEMGWKGSWMDRRLQVNGSIYLVEYEDFQSQTFSGSDIKVLNAGTLESYGTEIDVTYIATMNLMLGTAIGYNKAEYKEFKEGQCTINQTYFQYYITEGNTSGAPGTTGSCTVDLKGKPLDNAPEWTFSSYIQYEKELADDLVSITRLEHSYVDSFFLDGDLDPRLKNDDVDLINLRLTLTDTDRDWEVALWGRNLLDEEYFAFAIDIPVMGGYAGVVAPQKTFGITLRKSFQ